MSSGGLVLLAGLTAGYIVLRRWRAAGRCPGAIPRPIDKGHSSGATSSKRLGVS